MNTLVNNHQLMDGNEIHYYKKAAYLTNCVQPYFGESNNNPIGHLPDEHNPFQWHLSNEFNCQLNDKGNNQHSANGAKLVQQIHNYLPQSGNPFMVRSQCVVCGDRARGCNFGAITCASCKEFFRRNAFKLNKLKCYFQFKCEINRYSRRFCAACRLEKCYQKGMKNEFIMSEAEKKERNLKIMEKKSIQNKSIHGSERWTLESGPSYFNEYEFGMNEKALINATIDNYQNSTEQHLDYSSFPLHYFNVNKIDDESKEQAKNELLNFKSENSIKNYTNEISLEDPEIVIQRLRRKVKIIRESNYIIHKFHLLLLTKDMGQKLTEHGSCKLKYLTSIVQILLPETVSDLPIDQKFIDLIRIAEIVTFNFIKMCKKLYAFQALSQEDQVALVKGGVMDTLMIWSVMTVNLEKECWEAVDLERNFRFSLKMELLKEANPKLFEQHQSYVMSFESDWRYDDNLMSLLIAIALFNPDRPNLSNHKMISDERMAYCNLLKNYLCAFAHHTANDIYHRLMKQLKLTEKISECHMKAYFDLNTKSVSENFCGLFMEIFNLNDAKQAI